MNKLATQSVGTIRTQYQAAQHALARLQPRIANSELERKELKHQLAALKEENNALRQQLSQFEAEHGKLSRIDKYEREIEHLRQKVVEMDALVREKDTALSGVFQSKTFRIGSVVTKAGRVFAARDK